MGLPWRSGPLLPSPGSGDPRKEAAPKSDRPRTWEKRPACWIQETKTGRGHRPSSSAAWLGKSRHGFTQGRAGSTRRPLRRSASSAGLRPKVRGWGAGSALQRGCRRAGPGWGCRSLSGRSQRRPRPAVAAAGGNLCSALEDSCDPGGARGRRRRVGGLSGRRHTSPWSVPVRPRGATWGGAGGPATRAAALVKNTPCPTLPLAGGALLSQPNPPHPNGRARRLSGENSAFYQFVLSQGWLRAFVGREGLKTP